MSTRALVCVKDQHSALWFYRHSDGYPEGTMPSLEEFMDHVRAGRLRDNVDQAAGWLVILGAQEYARGPQFYAPHQPSRETPFGEIKPYGDGNLAGWKVGAYEPTTWDDTEDHWQEYVYTVDLSTRTISIADAKGKPVEYKTSVQRPDKSGG